MAKSKSTVSRRPSQSKSANGQWKGGRSVASNGYVLIKVGFDHHLADVRGYAYEHRIVAEQKLGRRLLAGEQVHHVNGNKQDNRPENIEVVPSLAHHRVHHRTLARGLKSPDEPNQEIDCQCGCGERFLKYDASGRPRAYISGHNPSESPVKDAILSSLGSGALHVTEIAMQTGLLLSAVKSSLSKMRKAGTVVRVKHGVWSVNNG